MRDKDTVKLETIRMLRAAIQRKEVDDQIQLDDEGVLQIIQKMIKQSTDAAEQFIQGSRQDLADKENQNIAVLKTYLPEQLSEDEISVIISKAMADTGAATMKDMGKVMALVKSQLQGRADMGAVSGKIKSLLS